MNPGVEDTIDPSPKERLTAMLAAAREEYAATARLGQAGRDVQARFADRIDDLIRAVADIAETPGVSPFAICAVGGFGRRALCLHSDIDLFIVFDGTIARPEERAV